MQREMFGVLPQRIANYKSNYGTILADFKNLKSQQKAETSLSV